MKANKDTRKRLNGSTEPKRLEEERERLINQFLAKPVASVLIGFALIAPNASAGKTHIHKISHLRANNPVPPSLLIWSHYFTLVFLFIKLQCKPSLLA